jgi:uncharacterized membrane protein
MTDREQHALVTDYLARLRAEALRRLPPDRAEELVADIREHLDHAVPPGTAEADVRSALDRVGEPGDLVDEAGGATAPPPQPTDQLAPRSNRLEVAALICLVGSLLLFLLVPMAVLLLVAGMVMLLLSRRWTTADKVLGAIAYTALGAPAVLLVGLGVSLVSFTEGCSQQVDAGGSSMGEPICSGTGAPLPLWLLVVAAVAWLGYQVYVAVRLARHARVQQPG